MVAVDVVHMLWPWSSCPMCCSGGCSVWGRSCGLYVCSLGPWSLSMCHMCRGHYLCAMCYSCGCSALGHGCGLYTHGVGLLLLLMRLVSQLWSLCHVCYGRRCGMLGYGCGCCHCATCIVVIIFVLCIVVAGAACGVTVIVFAWAAWGHGCYQCAVYIVIVVFVPCVLWWQVWCMRLWSQSLCRGHGAAVAVDVLCVLWLWSSHCAYHSCRCGVSDCSCRCHHYSTCFMVVAFLLCMVSLVPSLCQMWCYGCGHHAAHSVYVAARGVAMGWLEGMW
jgi:hypothetical protein